MAEIKPTYKSIKPNANLLKYNTKELRQAANWIDRDNGSMVLLNIVSMFIKLQELNASIEIESNSSGVIKFNYGEKSIKRYFESASELSIAISLGPLDLHDKENLFFKADCGILKTQIKRWDSKSNMIEIYVPEIDLFKMIYLNGAEKILCNSLNGMTVGQLKVREIL